MMGFSIILALCTDLHAINISLIYVIILLSSIASSFEFPTRQSIIPTLVPREQMADALSLNSAMMQLTFIVGPTAGGFAIAWLALANTYWFDVFSYLCVIGSLLLMVLPRVPVAERPQAGFCPLFSAMRF